MIENLIAAAVGPHLGEQLVLAVLLMWVINFTIIAIRR